MPEQRNIKWSVNLMETSQDSRGTRLFSKAPYCAQLVNVDGRTPGGVKPFPGFTRLRWLGLEIAGENEYYSRGAGYPTPIQVDFAPAAVDQPTEVWDLFPFSVRMGVDETIRGFVVRGMDSTSPDPVPYVFVEYYWEGEWYFTRISDPSGGPTWTVGLEDEPMSLVCDGRLMYLMQRNRPTLSMHFTPTEVESGAYIFTDPILTVLHTGPAATEDYPLVVNNSTSLDAWDSGIRIMDILAVPSIEKLPAYGVGAKFGSSEALRTHVQATEQYTAPNTNNIRAKLGRLGKGDLVFCYQLYNADTGRLSQYSENASVRLEDYDDDTPVSHYFLLQIGPTKLASLVAEGWTHIYIYRSLAAQDAGNAMTMALKFEEAFVSLTDSGLGPDAGHVVAVPPSPTGSYAEGSLIRWFILTDNALVVKDLALDTIEFDEQMPYAGAGVNYSGLLVTAASTATGAERGDADSHTGVGEIRWSAVSRDSMQLFPPDNRWVDEGVFEEPHQLLLVDDRVIGFSMNRQYLVYRSGAYVVTRSMQKGWGTQSRKGACVAGSAVYAASSLGIITVDSSGVMNAITAMDGIFRGRWANDLASVVAVFDPHAKCVFFLNPVKDQGIVFWFTTSMASEMWHMPFATAATGQIPYDWNSFPEGDDVSYWVMDDGRLMVPQWTQSYGDRGSWIDRYTEAGVGNNGDYARSFRAEITLVLEGNQLVLQADNVYDAPGAGARLPSADENFVGTYLVVCDGSDAAKYAKILSFDTTVPETGVVSVLLDRDLGFGLSSVGTKVFINGVYTRVMPSALGYTMEQTEQGGYSGDTGDFFKERVVQSIAAFIEPLRPATEATPEDNLSADGSVPLKKVADEGEALWWAYVLKNLDETPFGQGTLVGGAGSVMTLPMTRDEPFQGAYPVGRHGARGARVFPVFETVTSWVNWIMPAMQVSGNVTILNREGLSQ